MSKRAIALTADHAWLEEFDNRLTRIARGTVEQIEFLKRRADQVTETALEEKKALWAQAQNQLRSAGLLPAEYDESKGDYLSLVNGALVYHKGGDKGKSPLDQLLAQILGRDPQ